ncbi:hypothetical protein SAMN04487819_109198 [Actinopolyspora alba]|uniref:Uncharacterized protein n=1 Tax=Actinopolyspora alba TaxID=673379 RepID=A0A1I1YVS8_9ACTN|nr:hypothetical protein [Actinopolyspora alba]SFE22140.1 hypothetical protein SAMN04487819_109198 [Actinopolyspora alba]
MTESSTGKARRRSSRVSQQLERARQRNAEQLAEQRAREQRVEAALRQYVEAGETIAAEHARCEEKVAVYQRKIDKLRADSQEKVADQHTRQAQAALSLHEGGGRTVEQVAELLELDSEKQARRLIATGREAVAPTTDTESLPDDGQREGGPLRQETPSANATSADGSGEQVEPVGDVGQQHGAQTGLVPVPTAHDDGQGT